MTSQSTRVVAAADVYVTDTFHRLASGSWDGSAALGPREPMQVMKTSRDPRGQVVLRFDRWTTRTLAPDRQVVISERGSS